MEPDKKKRKFDSSLFISLLSIIIALVALFVDFKSLDSQEPNLSIEQGVPKISPYLDSEDNKWKALTYNRLTITNTGGKTVTLLGLNPPQELPLSMGINSGKITDQSIKQKIIPINLMFEEIDSKIVKNYKEASLEELSIINLAIEPGKSIILNYVIIFDVYKEQERLVDLVLFNLDLKFGNEEVIPFKQGYPIPLLDEIN